MNNIAVGLHAKNATISVVRVTVSGFTPIAQGGRTVYGRLRIKVGEIPTSQWDGRFHRPTAAFSRRDGGALHRSIDMAVLNLQRAYHEATMKTTSAVRIRYDELLGKRIVTRKGSTLLSEVVQNWSLDRTKNEATLITYRVFLKKLKDYERNTGVNIDMAHTTQGELQGFLSWCVDKDSLSLNSAWKLQKAVNKAIGEVKKEGVRLDPISVYAYRTPRKEVLDWEDVARIVRYEPRTRSEADYQVIVVAMALSSVRISDLWLFLRNIDRRGGLLCSEVVVTKHPHPTISPIVFEPLRVLLERNGMPAYRTEQLVRRGVAKLLRSIGIGKQVQIHSLRRSFVSNFLALGLIPDHLLARVFTGHAISGDRSIFHRYNHAGMLTAQMTVIQLLRMVDTKQTGGLELLSDHVCLS